MKPVCLVIGAGAGIGGTVGTKFASEGYHDGISFLVFDMQSDGVEARPIKLISGSSPFCETFFTDVKVPKDQLVGELNAGWTIAKRLLQFERSSISAGGFGGTGGSGILPPQEYAKQHERGLGYAVRHREAGQMPLA